MKLALKKGSTSVSLYVFIQDSSSTTGGGKTGLAYNTASLTAYYVRPLGSATSITLATQTVTGAWSSGGFVEVDATNMPGVYRFDVPDAVLATGVNSAAVMLKGASGMAPLPLEVELVAYDPQDSVRMGLTALPNAAAEAAGGLYTRGTGAGQIAQQANGQIDANLSTIKTQTVTCAAGVTVLASVGTASTNTAQTGDAYARLGAPAGASVSADVAAVKTDSAAIKLKTDNLPSSPAAVGSAMTLTSAYDPAKTAAQAGDAMALTSGERTTLTGVIWAALTSGLTTVGSIGKLLVDNVNATISSRSTYAGGDTSGTTTLLSRIGAALTITGGKVDVNDKTGFALTSAYDPAKTAAQAGDAMALTSGERTTLAAAIWAALTSGLTTVGSVGKLIVDYLDAAISSRSTYAGGDTSGTTTLLGRLTSTRAGNLDNLDAAVSTRLASSSYTAPDNTSITAIKAKTDNLPSDPADASDIAASFSTVNTTLATIAGYIDTEVAAIKAKTDNLPADPAGVSDLPSVPTAAQVADKVLGRNLAGGSDGGRTVQDALRSLRNKVSISGDTMTVCAEDDTTAAWTAELTTDATATPITAVDPA